MRFNSYTIWLTKPDAPKEEIPVSIFDGPEDDKALGQFQEMGIDRVVFFVLPAGADTLLPLLDKYQGYISQFA